ncbi:MAG: ABC transporter ATP-binding protein [Rhodospirillaceae bacterium]|jgi:multiple sugar transport system ATP-binding protein|nr:ABC transporter ATP-binding protein [Rhodospirillaceae bacterium]MBT4488013.1 ABC transporter ATP-binding protein [Rhodospirillaceae bacterium]MBT5192633.1 ABC transporter ATP-binding protein [Rhodospirillaceae bacterium]MBT5895624.1 ABC transporter ATP-binding protein [Rhodospirillaceae bacterium]MBT7756798.1 ABC transporter ATP-binding protein [Rhodospirillaceae bacterium]
MSHLIIQDLHKSFGDLRALQGVDMVVEKGEFFVLLGPSAAGKTTTLRMVCGIERADQGRVVFDGEDVTGAEVRGRDMAMVFQTFALYPHMTIFDNLAYPLRQSGMAKADVVQRVNEVAEMLRLGHTLARKPGTASGGEQQRVAIGRALVRRPSLLLLDEPLTNLDAKLRFDTRAEFKRLHRELGMTIVYATPDELEALSMGQRIALLRGGRIVQTGTPDELYTKPQDTYVAGMVGSPKVNLIPAIRRGADDAPLVEMPFGAVQNGPWADALKPFPVGSELIFGFRPHDVAPATDTGGDDGDGGGTMRIAAKVHLIEPLGDVVILDLTAGETQLKMVLPEEQAIRYSVGDDVPVNLRVENSFLFARETGTAIC